MVVSPRSLCSVTSSPGFTGVTSLRISITTQIRYTHGEMRTRTASDTNAQRSSRRGVNVRRPVGRIMREETYQVKIPPGVTEGQKLRLAGRGETGAGGGAAGDLFLRVRLAKHPDFEVDGHNLIHEAELAPWEAVLGASISVPTLGGQLSIKIPPGTQAGQKLRLRGRGLPQPGGVPGDIILVTRIAVPEKVTDTERKLWEQLQHASKFNPRD